MKMSKVRFSSDQNKGPERITRYEDFMELNRLFQSHEKRLNKIDKTLTNIQQSLPIKVNIES